MKKIDEIEGLVYDTRQTMQGIQEDVSFLMLRRRENIRRWWAIWRFIWAELLVYAACFWVGLTLGNIETWQYNKFYCFLFFMSIFYAPLAILIRTRFFGTVP